MSSLTTDLGVGLCIIFFFFVLVPSRLICVLCNNVCLCVCKVYAMVAIRPAAVLPKPPSSDKNKPAPQPDTEEKQQTQQQQQEVIDELKNRFSQREELHY